MKDSFGTYDGRVPEPPYPTQVDAPGLPHELRCESDNLFVFGNSRKKAGWLLLTAADEIDRLTLALAAAERERDEARADVARLKTGVDILSAERDGARRERDESEIAFQAAHKELDETQALLTTVEHARDAAQTALATAQERIKRLEASVDVAAAADVAEDIANECIELAHERDALKAALEMVEFMPLDFGLKCLWCGNIASPLQLKMRKFPDIGHKADCPRQLALASPRSGEA